MLKLSLHASQKKGEKGVRCTNSVDSSVLLRHWRDTVYILEQGSTLFVWDAVAPFAIREMRERGKERFH